MAKLTTDTVPPLRYPIPVADQPVTYRNLNVIWGLVISTCFIMASLTGMYFGLKQDIQHIADTQNGRNDSQDIKLANMKEDQDRQRLDLQSVKLRLDTKQDRIYTKN